MGPVGRTLFAPVVLLTALAACGERHDDGGSAASLPIQGGEVDTEHPAVGILWLGDGSYCSATLITPTTVLTAGHCVTGEVSGFYTGTGTPTTSTTSEPAGMVKHSVDKHVAHPTYAGSDSHVLWMLPVPIQPPAACPNPKLDIGLVHLTEPITDIAPIPYGTNASPAASTVCEAVGFGLHLEDGGDTTRKSKRHGTEIVQAVTAANITVSMGTAIADSGDSGGPLICNDVVVGATSCHTDGDFPSHRTEYYGRVDQAANWIAMILDDWSATRTSSLTHSVSPIPTSR